MSDVLRIGLLVDSLVQPRWIYETVRDLQASGIARVVLVVRRGAAPAPAKGKAGRLWRNRRTLLYELYTKLDARKRRTGPDPFEQVDIAPLVDGAAILDVVPRETKHCDYLADVAVESIRSHDLDVAVRFGFRILKGRALEIARFGVWSYHHGDNLVNRGGPAGFWEVMEGHPSTGCILQVLTEELDAGHVLYRSWSATDRSSVLNNRRNYYWKSGHFLMRMLGRLHREGPAVLAEVSNPAEWTPYHARLYTRPSNAEMARLLIRRATRKVQRHLSALVSMQQWCLAYIPPRRNGHSDEPLAPSLHRARLLVPPRGRFWADPFIVKEGDRFFIFFEEWIDSARKAHISVMELAPDGRLSDPRRVLERHHHLSYPFVFRWNGEHYMVPETESNETVELYRATSFPHEWELDTVLMRDIRLVDATIAEIGGWWWLFGNVILPGVSSWDELHLFRADTPRGPWTPHPMNPVKSDARSARPAGRLFRWRGKHYRPAQDCSAAYGSAIVINRIDRIDEDRYVETPVSRIEPTWRPALTGVHTLDMVDGLTVLDVRLRRPRW